MRLSACFVALASLLPVFLTGCAMESIDGTSAAGGLAIQGKVHGGQQPLVGAQVYLLAANTTGYGSASVSLLTGGTGRTQDTSGGPTNGFYYVSTASDGSFSITGDYTCTPGTQVYVYALGGNPGGGTNPAAGLMAALGNCPSAGNFLAAAPYIFVNEVSTVAAAYAISGFATDAVHVSSSGTAAAKLGIANAFINAAMLETLSTGVANLYPPALTTGAGGGAIPQAEINTLGNILASCVNSNGAVTGPSNPTTCYTLFTNAMSGGSTGTMPTDTATAAINIAHNPVATVSALYGLSTAYAQFSPTLTGQPSDFTMSIYFNDGFLSQGGGLAVDAGGNLWTAANAVFKWNGQAYDFTGGNGYTGVYGSVDAIDVNGNAWILNSSSVGKYNNAGTLLSPAGGYTGLNLSGATSIALDASSNAWIGDGGNGNVVKVSSSGTVAGTFTGGGLSGPGPIAIDPSGNAWIADGSGVIVELSPTGTPLSGTAGYSVPGLSPPLTGMAIDHSGNVWVTGSGGLAGSVVEISNTGTVLSGSSGYANTSRLGNPGAIAIDGAGNAWVAGGNATSEISPNGTYLSGPLGFLAADGVNSIAIDGSGDVWLNFASYNFLFGYTYYIQEMVGAATPVVTPLSVAVKNNMLGTRP